MRLSAFVRPKIQTKFLDAMLLPAGNNTIVEKQANLADYSADKRPDVVPT